ncbi:MAG: molybdenum cofactor guanylyltransferase [Candidatus Bathyarchaeia archaeon]
MKSAIVLSGGKSSRFGENKALKRLKGKPLFRYVIDNLPKSEYEVVLVIGLEDRIDKFSRFLSSSITITKDDLEGCGPLAGILSGLKMVSSTYTAILPCDSPFIKPEVVDFLFKNVRRHEAIIPKWPNGYIEPLHAVYKVKPALKAAREAIDRKELYIVDMIKRLKTVKYVSTNRIKRYDNKLLTFFNVNTKSDFEKAKRIISKRN